MEREINKSKSKNKNYKNEFVERWNLHTCTFVGVPGDGEGEKP